MSNAKEISYGHTKKIKEKIVKMQEPTLSFIECYRLERLYKEWCEKYDKLASSSISLFMGWLDKFGLINTDKVKEMFEIDK